MDHRGSLICSVWDSKIEKLYIPDLAFSFVESLLILLSSFGSLVPGFNIEAILSKQFEILKWLQYDKSIIRSLFENLWVLLPQIDFAGPFYFFSIQLKIIHRTEELYFIRTFHYCSSYLFSYRNAKWISRIEYGI